MTVPFYSGKYVCVESRAHGVQKLILTRPDSRNAFHDKMISEINQALTLLAAIEDPMQMRLLILEGEGKVFSAGADLSYMKEQAQKNEEQNLCDAHVLGTMFFNLAAFPTPVICAVKGAAIGGGLGLTVCADYVLCQEKTIFLTSEVLLGLIPGVISPYIIRKIGLAHAASFMLSGQKMEAQEALRVGLVNRISSEDNFTKVLNEVTNQFLQAGPLAARKTKELIRNCLPLPNQELFQFCAKQIAFVRCSEEGQTGLNSFFEKQTPYWSKEG